MWMDVCVEWKVPTDGERVISLVYITAVHAEARKENKEDFGMSGRDEDPTFTWAKEG